MLAGGFEQIQRTQRVHLKIDQRNVSGFIVRGLRGAMDNQVKRVFLEDRLNPHTIPDVEIIVAEILGGTLKTLQVPGRVSRNAKELAPHVVIDTDDGMPLPVKVLHSFGTDEAAAARY